MKTSGRLCVGLIALLLPVLAGTGLCGTKVQTAHLVVDDDQGQLTAAELERFAAEAENAFAKALQFWAIPDRGAGKVILELHGEQRGTAFTVFQMESTGEGKRRFVRVYGVKDPREMVHKLTHALFPTEDKLIRNMMGIPTELRFGNPRSFPMCGYDPDAWVTAIRRANSYLPLDDLGEAHEDWGMSFQRGLPVVSDRKRQHASYAEAGSCGNFLLNRFGVEKVKGFFRASRQEKRPWKKVFGLEMPELEALWLKSLEAEGKTPADGADVLTALWKSDPATACYQAEKGAAKR
jgi:hypothetical protein